MPRRHVRLDSDLDHGVLAFARRHGLTKSQAIRDLLRQALGNASPVDRGWREGFAQGHRDHQLLLHAQAQATLAGLSPPGRARRPSE